MSTPLILVGPPLPSHGPSPPNPAHHQRAQRAQTTLCTLVRPRGHNTVANNQNPVHHKLRTFGSTKHHPRQSRTFLLTPQVIPKPVTPASSPASAPTNTTAQAGNFRTRSNTRHPSAIISDAIPVMPEVMMGVISAAAKIPTTAALAPAIAAATVMLWRTAFQNGNTASNNRTPGTKTAISATVAVNQADRKSTRLNS